MNSPLLCSKWAPQSLAVQLYFAKQRLFSYLQHIGLSTYAEAITARDSYKKLILPDKTYGFGSMPLLLPSLSYRDISFQIHAP